jgi:hypothetical protein
VRVDTLTLTDTRRAVIATNWSQQVAAMQMPSAEFDVALGASMADPTTLRLAPGETVVLMTKLTSREQHGRESRQLV